MKIQFSKCQHLEDLKKSYVPIYNRYNTINYTDVNIVLPIHYIILTVRKERLWESEVVCCVVCVGWCVGMCGGGGGGGGGWLCGCQSL